MPSSMRRTTMMARASPAPATAHALPPGLLDGERSAIARAISSVERGSSDFSAALAAHLGRAHVVGVTGAPGAGKSTLIDALLGELLARGLRIGVVAVDPSSPVSGGALLGDRVRMGRHGEHERVFIRSLASRGQLGGLSRCTAQVVDLLDAARFDVVIVETVGAGQSEVEILHVADTRVVVCPPGLGDDVQALKAGILEIADLLVVTKADLPGAATTARDLEDMLHLRSTPAEDAWRVAVLRTAAGNGEGVAALADAVQAHARAAGRGRRLARRSLAPGAADGWLRRFGIACSEAGAGPATASLTLTGQHLDAGGRCHRSVVFALADVAFALATAEHDPAAGVTAQIAFERPALPGETLVARAVEVPRPGEPGVCRVEVFAGEARVASFSATIIRGGTGSR